MGAVDETTRPRGAPTPPPPAQVPGNLWTEIAAAELGGLSPTLTVSVVVGGDDPDGLLALTLASLSTQSYPAELTEVLVERDAGPAPELPASARHRPAVRAVGSPGEAEGEVLLLMDAGSIAEGHLIEAHARWHHAVCDAASVGTERSISPSGLEADDVARAASVGGLQELLAARVRESDGERAVEAYLERTRQLTAPDPDSFWVAATGSVAVRREVWAQAGGRSGEGDQRLARLDVAWRLAAAGTVVVPEREAVTYAAYDRAPAAPRPAGEGEEERDPRAGNLIPAPGYRGKRSGRRRRRPALRVEIPVDDQSAADVLDTLDSILRGSFSDLEAVLLVPAAHPDRESLELACDADPRVSVAAPGAGPLRTDARVQLTVPPVAVVGEDTLAELSELFVAEGVGLARVAVSGRLRRLERRGRPLGMSRRTTVQARATGPLARARRIGRHRGVDPDQVLAELFGERAVAGAAIGVRRRGTSLGRDAEDDGLPPASDLAHERAEHLRNRARAATNQARADRKGQLLTRERMRANHERARADRLEARLALISPRVWARWRSRQTAARARAVPERMTAAAEAPRRAALKARQAAAAVAAKRRG